MKKVLENKIKKILNNFKGDFKIDSRDIKKGDIFVVLKGSKDHGKYYIEDALKKGALKIISENTNSKYKNKIIKVSNCKIFLKEIAKFKRKKFTGKVIAVTGSVGKTSTKEQLKFFLKFEMKSQASIKSYNNELGVSLSLCNLRLNSSVAIFEIGTNNFGEIKKLTKIVKPNISIITNISSTHLKYFKNIKNVAKEKYDMINPKYNNCLETVIIPYNLKFKTYLYKILDKQKIKIYTFGDQKKSNLVIKKIHRISKNKFLLKINYNKKNYNYKILTLAKHQAVNSLIVILVFFILKLNIKKIFKNALYLPELKGRGNIDKVYIFRKKTLLIDETYNASPLSMKETIKYFKEYESNKKYNKILILGDMLELGKKEKSYHREISNYLNVNNFFQVILFGNLILNLYKTYKNKKNIFYFSNQKELIKHLAKYIKKNTIILAKGSNSSSVNIFFKKLYNKELIEEK
ncbi:MAG: hypothetical protein CMI98_04020 [Pelagibacteraceae bacterium]|nr:hypothetical protein [Pelagibacteraceae bacterium]